MDGLAAIMTRRSIRTFTADPVSDSDIDTLLRAAMAAPSAGNQQPWRFVVVTEHAQLQALAEATPYAAPVGRAPLAIVVCGDTRAEKHPGYWVQDCSAAVQNTLVAVNAIGLGAVWIGVHPVAERSGNVARICGVPSGIVPLAMIAIGHPAEEKPPAERYEPAHVHRDRFRE
jgi:nitroreductase